VIQVNK